MAHKICSTMGPRRVNRKQIIPVPRSSLGVKGLKKRLETRDPWQETERLIPKSTQMADQLVPRLLYSPRRIITSNKNRLGRHPNMNFLQIDYKLKQKAFQRFQPTSRHCCHSEMIVANTQDDVSDGWRR